MKRLLAVVFVCGLALALDSCCPAACRGTCNTTGRPNRLHIVTYRCGTSTRQVTVTAGPSGGISILCCSSVIDVRPF